MKMSAHINCAQDTLDNPQMRLGIPAEQEVRPYHVHSALAGDEIITAQWILPSGRIELEGLHMTRHPNGVVVDTNRLWIYEGGNDGPTRRLASRQENRRFVSIEIAMLVGERWLVLVHDFRRPIDKCQEIGYYNDIDRERRLGDETGEVFVELLDAWHPLRRPTPLVLPPLPDTSGQVSEPSDSSRSGSLFGYPHNRYVSPLG